MPGPKADYKGAKRGPAQNSPNRKTAARLAARQAVFATLISKPGEGLMLHKPGSQNRKK